jgi:hypothetical protein
LSSIRQNTQNAERNNGNDVGLMKVSDNLKKMMVEEFQHFREFQLIKMMNISLHLIQFEHIKNRIQMKLMKTIYTQENMMIREFQNTIGD